jgi:hypothetical protein
MGTMLDSGRRVKKNQKIPKESNLYLEDMRMAAKRMAVKNKILIKTGALNKDL